MYGPALTDPPPGNVAPLGPPHQQTVHRVSSADIEIEPRTNSSADWAYSIALFVLALAPRLFIALAFSREPVWDGHYYHFGATRIAEGFGYSEDVSIGGELLTKPWTHYPVGYSGMLALFYRVFGSGILTAPVINAVLGSALVVLIHRVARYMLSLNRARVAGALGALHPGLIAYSAIIMTESLAALLLLAAAWVALAQRQNVRAYALVGLLIGLGALVRPSSLWVLPALLLVGPLPVPRALTRTGFAALVALLTVMPWTIRNCQVMDGCAFVSTNGGWNLAIGALTETGRFTTLRADDGCPVVTGQVQQDRCWAEVGWNTIKADPRSWLKKIPKKLQQTYDHESFPIEYLREAAPDLWPEPRRKAGHEMLTLFHFLLMTAVAFSPITLVTSVRRRVSALTQGLLLLSTAAYASYCFASPEHPFYALMVMTPFIAFLPFPGRQSLGPAGRFLFVALFFTSLTHAVFFGEDRYHLVISPVLCILAAGALRTESQPAQWAQK